MTALGLLACLASPLSAAALSVVDVADDNALRTLLGGPAEPDLAVTAEGRIGDRGGAATFELDLGQYTSAPAVTRNFGWIAGTLYDFSLSYAGGTVTYALGGETLQFAFAPAQGGTTDLFIRARATDSSSVTFTGLALGGVTLDGGAVSAGAFQQSGAGVGIVRVAGASFFQGAGALTGRVALDWAGAPPTNSNLAFQIKIAQPVPEPGTWAMMLVGLVGIGAIARRRLRG